MLHDAFAGRRALRRAVSPKQVTDGLSKTACSQRTTVRRRDTLGRVGQRPQYLSQKRDDANQSASGSSNEIGSPHPGGASLVFCDAHVEFVCRDNRPSGAQRHAHQGGRRAMRNRLCSDRLRFRSYCKCRPGARFFHIRRHPVLGRHRDEPCRDRDRLVGWFDNPAGVGLGFSLERRRAWSRHAHRGRERR